MDRCLQIDARRAPDYQRLKAEQIRERSDSRERRKQRADDGQSGDDKIKKERKFVGRKGTFVFPDNNLVLFLRMASGGILTHGSRQMCENIFNK